MFCAHVHRSEQFHYVYVTLHTHTYTNRRARSFKDLWYILVYEHVYVENRCIRHIWSIKTDSMWLHFMCAWHFFIRIICLLSYSSVILFGLCVAVVFLVYRERERERAIAAIQYISFSFLLNIYTCTLTFIYTEGKKTEQQ